MAAEEPAFDGQLQPPSPACITQIDITSPARVLAVLRWSDSPLVFLCGFAALSSLPDLVAAVLQAQWSNFLQILVLATTMAGCATTGWLHLGVIDPRIWRWYLRVFPVLGTVGVMVALVTLAEWIAGLTDLFQDTQSMMALVGGVWFVGIAIPGFVCVLLLRAMRVEPMGIPFQELLIRLIDRESAAPHITRVARPGLHRGLTYGGIGAIVLLGMPFVPMAADPESFAAVLVPIWLLNTLAYFLLVRARRHFQVSADALLAVDKRHPILFLRSFADDERQRYMYFDRALLDFSLETRLVNHFHHFGPFIAVGSPKDTVPQVGAARVLLADDEWRSRVLDWMRAASLIVMFGGTSEWVNWELRQVVESGRSTSLILMIPEIRGWRSSRRRQDLAARVRQIRDAFGQTPWNEELLEFNDFLGLRALLFRADGSMVMVRSRSRSRDSYHLAALVAHQQLLDPMPKAMGMSVRVDAPTSYRSRVVAVILSAAAALAAVVYLLLPWGVESPSAKKLTFGNCELYYTVAVPATQAQEVGRQLLQIQYFGNHRRADVHFSREQGVYQLRYVVDESRVNEPGVLRGYRNITLRIAEQVLGRQPIVMDLCDDEWHTLRSERVEPVRDRE